MTRLLPSFSSSSLFFLLLLFAASASIAVEVRVFVPLWLSDIGNNYSWDLTETQAESVSFALAVKHFNDRRDDIIPALASVVGCEKNITLVKICDESGNPRRATHALAEFTGQYDIVAGFASIAARDASTFSEATADVPVISHWVSEEILADKKTYPLFSRTFISDTAIYSKVATFIAQLGYSYVAVIYVDTDTVPAAAKLLDTLLNDLGIDSISFPYITEDDESVENAILRVKATERNVIVYLGWELDLSASVARFANEHGLNSTEKIWIYSPIDIYPSDEEIGSNPGLKRFLHGSFYFDFKNPDETLANEFLEKFPSEFAADPGLVSSINGLMPPFGGMNETSGSCSNDALNMSLPLDYFDTVDLSGYGTVHFAAYDAIMAIGLAACTDPSATMPSSGQEFSDLIRAVDFEGLSGTVKFTETGDRDESAVNFTVYNWQTQAEDGSLVLALVGRFTGSEWTFFDESSIQLRAGMGLEVLPGNFTKPHQEYTYLPDGLKILGYFEVISGLLACLICLAWMFKHRDSTVVRASQPLFMTTMVFGCMVVIVAILPLTVGDQPGARFQGNTGSCMGVIYMFFLGWAVILGSLVGKTLRVYYIFERTSLYHQRVRQWHVLAFILGLIGIDLALIISMHYVAPFTFVRVAMSTDQRGEVTESRGECSFSVHPESRGFFGGLLVIYASLIVAFRYVSTLSRKRFIEEKNQSTALIQLFVLIVPAVAAAFTFVSGRFVILSTYFIVSVFVVLIFGFLPKYLTIREQAFHARVQSVIDKERQDNQSNADVDVLDGLRIPLVQAKFERFAEENYVTESYLFVLDVITLKEEFEKASVPWKLQKVSSIMHVYIEVGALLQVNISERCRLQTVEKYKRVMGGKEVLAEDIFDVPLKEVADMLNFGAWAQFVQDGGMFNVRNSLLPKSKVMGWFFTNPTQSNPHETGIGSSKKTENSSGGKISSSRISDLSPSMGGRPTRTNDAGKPKPKSDLAVSPESGML